VCSSDLFTNVLAHRPVEAITTPDDDPDELMPRAD